MDIAFDIETMPNSAMIARLPEPEVKTGNLKDPAKIEEKIESARIEQVAKMALSPLYGRVCAFVGMEDSNTFYHDCIKADSDDEEVNVLETAFKIIGGKRTITYNGTGFDLPFIYRRAVVLGVDIRQFGAPTLAEMTARYNNKHHVDLMTAWCGFGQFEKLDNLAGAFLNDAKLEVDFAEFPEMIKTEEGRIQLLEYCKQDVVITLKLWNRIAGILI